MAAAAAAAAEEDVRCRCCGYLVPLAGCCIAEQHMELATCMGWASSLLLNAHFTVCSSCAAVGPTMRMQQHHDHALCGNMWHEQQTQVTVQHTKELWLWVLDTGHVTYHLLLLLLLLLKCTHLVHSLCCCQLLLATCQQVDLLHLCHISNCQQSQHWFVKP
jgi:hypothetical protein